MPPPLVVNFATSPWINPQTPNSNPNVCNYCFSNHSVVNVICSRFVLKIIFPNPIIDYFA